MKHEIFVNIDIMTVTSRTKLLPRKLSKNLGNGDDIRVIMKVLM